MKKYWWLILTLIVVFIITLTYILIPSNIIVSNYVYIKCKPPSTIRYLHDTTRWQQWLSKEINSGKKFIYNGDTYKPLEATYSSLKVLVIHNSGNYASQINVIPIGTDSSAVQWQFNFRASNNPLKRIMQYQNALHMRNNIAMLLNNFKKNSLSTKNIYGFDIRFTTLTDTALVSTKTSLKEYPSTKIIYIIIAELQNYIKDQHAIQHNYPMLNITQQKSGIYEVKIGIPTNIFLKGDGVIEPKRMIMLKNKALVTEVTGDVKTIDKALFETSNYMDDNRLYSPVIPFQQLVTDRSKQPDSTKWVTRIFTPII